MDNLRSDITEIAEMETHSADKLISKATECTAHLQLQVDIIQEVLVELGYLKSEEIKEVIVPDVPERQPENPYFTPKKMREDLRISADISPSKKLCDSPKLENLGLSSLGMSVMGLLPNKGLDEYTTYSPALPVIESFQQKGNRDSVDTIEPLRLTSDLSNLNIIADRDSMDTFDMVRSPKRASDPNSLFNSLVNQIKQDEYEDLPAFIKSQMTREYLNKVINGKLFLIFNRVE